MERERHYMCSISILNRHLWRTNNLDIFLHMFMDFKDLIFAHMNIFHIFQYVIHANHVKYFVNDNDCIVKMFLPVDCNSCHGINAGKHGGDGKEVVELAVDLSKVPLSVRGVNEIDQRIKGSHRGVGESQVEQEIVSDRAHPFMGQNDPNYNEVSKHGDRQY